MKTNLKIWIIYSLIFLKVEWFLEFLFFIYFQDVCGKSLLQLKLSAMEIVIKFRQSHVYEWNTLEHVFLTKILFIEDVFRWVNKAITIYINLSVGV